MIQNFACDMDAVLKLFVIPVLVLSLLGLASCSDDSETTSAGEFIEVELDGVSRVEVIEGSAISSSGEFSFLSSSVIDDVDIMLTVYSDLNRLASSSLGEYRFCPDGDPQNLDFEISVRDGDYNCIFCKSGTHTVTAVKRSGNEVVVEGKFHGTLEDDRSVRGKYRLAFL